MFRGIRIVYKYPYITKVAKLLMKYIVVNDHDTDDGSNVLLGFILDILKRSDEVTKNLPCCNLKIVKYI